MAFWPRPGFAQLLSHRDQVRDKLLTIVDNEVANDQLRVVHYTSEVGQEVPDEESKDTVCIYLEAKRGFDFLDLNLMLEPSTAVIQSVKLR